jgi:plastocyanin
LFSGTFIRAPRRQLAAASLAALMVSACSNPTPAPEPAPAPPAAADSTLAVVSGLVPRTSSGTPAVVILEPRDEDAQLPAPGGIPVMDQVARTFIPPILFVRTGYAAEFRNSDDEIHNINVKDGVTRVQAFNVAVPTGEHYAFTFKGTGVYDVSCDIHAGMSAQIVATSTPYATLADDEGRFTFPDVVPGTYELIVYAGLQTIERTVEVAGAHTEVDATAP